MNPNELKKLIKEALEPVIETQEAIKAAFQPIIETQKEHSEKLDSITAELSQVHQLADVTLDVVTARYESNKREIDEIKDHLHLPKKPYFGKTS